MSNFIIALQWPSGNKTPISCMSTASFEVVAIAAEVDIDQVQYDTGNRHFYVRGKDEPVARAIWLKE